LHTIVTLSVVWSASSARLRDSIRVVRIEARRCFESTHVWTVASPLVSAYFSNAAGFRTIEQNADRAVLIDLIESCEREARKGGRGR
jgi:hypothetical protein